MLRATAAGEYGVSGASRLRRQGMQVICLRAFLAAWLAGLPAIVIVIMTGPVLGEGNGGTQEAGTISRSDKPVLTSLTVSAGTISPEFSGTHIDYTVADVPYGTRVLTITAIPESAAEVTYWHYPAGSIAELVDEDTTIEGLQVSLDVGNKVVEVSVTKGSRYRDYRLEITRLNPTVDIRAVGDGPVNEGETLVVEIRRSAATADSLAVRVLTEELEAEVGAGHANVLADDVDGTSRIYDIEGGDATTILRIKTSGDTVWEGHSRVRLSLVADDLYTIDTSAGAATVLVQDDEFPASTAVLTVSPNPVGEGAGETTATVTVTTTGDKKPHGEAFVAVEASDGTAEAGSDYTGVDATIKFAEADFSSVMVGEENRYRASKTVDVTVTQDTDDEVDETFSITASTKSGSPISVGEDDATVSVTITDDDEVEPAQPTLTSLTVDGGTITPAFSPGILSYTIPDVEYESDRLTIAAGAEAGTSVAFLDSSNSALADLDDMTAGQQVALGIGVTVVKIRVTKGDVSQDYSLSITRAKPTVSVRALTIDTAIEGDSLVFEVVRSAAAGDALAVKFTLDEIGAGTGVDPGDVLPDSQEEITHSVTIAADKIAVTVEIATISDAVWENHSKIQVEIADDDTYTVHGEEDSASVLVRDDEFVAAEAALSVAPNPVGEGAGKTVATVTVTTSGERVPHGLVMIPITTSAGTATMGSDFTTLDASLEFVEGDFSGVEVEGSSRFRASKSVDVVILQDSLGEEDETFVVALGTPSDTLVTLDADSKSNSVAITDDEPPALTGLSVSDGTLTPAFSSSGLSYTVPDVAYGTHLATINVTPGPGVGVSFLDASDNDYEDLDGMTDGQQVYLDIGSTTIKVRVSKGGVEQDYTMVFTRAKPKVSIRAVTTGHATEGDTLMFEVNRSAAAGDVLEVRVGMNEVDVVEGEGHGDILPDSAEDTSPLRTIEVDETSLVFSVDTVADMVWEKHSSVEMSIKPGTRYDIDSGKGTASVVVRDDDFPDSTASLTVSPNPVGEGVGSTVATVTVTTDAGRMPHGAVSIPISTSDGTATAGEDFTALDTSLSFSESDFSEVEVGGSPRFQASKSVDVVILQDSLGEEDETFVVALGTPSDTLVTLDADSKSNSVAITDDEPPALTGLSVSDGTLTPAFSSSGLSYTVPDVAYGTHLATINVTPGPGVGVSFLDASDNDYEDLDGMTDGQQVYLDIGSTTIKVRVSKGGVEQDYTMVFTRAKPKVSIRAVTTGHATEGDTLMFEVNRSAAAGDVLEVRVGMNEVDVVEGEGHGDILPDSAEDTSPLRTIEVDETSLVFSVDTVADMVWEKHSSVEMSIKPGTRYDIDSGKGTASVVVRDDDFPDSTASLTVSPNPVGEGVGSTVATVTVTTDAGRMPHGRVSIPIATSDGTATAGEDYVVVDSSLVFSEGDFGEVEEEGDTLFRATKSLEIAILDDTMDEDEETFVVALGTPSVSVVGIDSEARSVSVTIEDQNSSPVVKIATAPNPPEVLGRGTINLDGTATDSDNDTLTFAWTTDPVDFGTFDSPASEDATWTAPAPLSMEQGVTLTLRVSDDGTPTGITTADVRVTVRANQAPTVEITTKVGMVKGGETVMLGATVTDPEGGELTYQWSGEGGFADDSAKDTAWTAPAATGVEQIITLTLTVADELGLTDSDNIQVTVPAANADPTFPDTEDGERVLDEGAGVGARVGGPVTAMDGDNDTLIFSLGGVDATSFEIDGTGQISVAEGTTLDFEAKREYSVEVSVSDGQDEDGDMDHTVDASLTVRISVGDVEEAGKLTFFSDELRVGEEVRVGVRDPDNYEPSNTEGSVDDADVSSWLWERSDSRDGPWAEIIDSTTATYVPTVGDVDKYLRVTAGYIDRRGPGKSTSGVAGRVGMAGNSPPVVSVSPDMATISGCNAITLNATSSDADGDVLSYSWTAYPKVGQFDDAGMESTVWSGPGPGEPATTVELTLTVSDGRGGSAADSVVVTVRGEAVEMGVGE